MDIMTWAEEMDDLTALDAYTIDRILDEHGIIHPDDRAEAHTNNTYVDLMVWLGY